MIPSPDTAQRARYDAWQRRQHRRPVARYTDKSPVPDMRIEDVLNAGPSSRRRPGGLREPQLYPNKGQTGAGQDCKKMASIRH